MNIWTTVAQQKIFIISGLIVVAIIAAGSWYVANTTSDSPYVKSMPTPTAVVTQGESTDTTVGDMIIYLTEVNSAESAKTTYELSTSIPQGMALSGIEMSFTIFGATSVNTNLKSISTTATNGETGWQSLLNSTSTNESGDTKIEFSLININPAGANSSELNFGTITVAGANGQIPQFVLDQNSSSAFTKDDQKYNLILQIQSKE